MTTNRIYWIKICIYPFFRDAYLPEDVMQRYFVTLSEVNESEIPSFNN